MLIDELEFSVLDISGPINPCVLLSCTIHKTQVLDPYPVELCNVNTLT